MIPLAMVAATLIEMNAPAKLRHAERITATFGLSAPVAIDVAIAFAVSWKSVREIERQPRGHHENEDQLGPHRRASLTPDAGAGVIGM